MIGITVTNNGPLPIVINLTGTIASAAPGAIYGTVPIPVGDTKDVDIPNGAYAAITGQF
jgi:hypothetical protein